MADEKRAWEQREGEPNEAYARFLVYRNLGVTRTLDRAYRAFVGNRRKSSERSGTWQENATRFNWSERASDWDIDYLVSSGRDAAIAFVNALEKLAVKSLSALEDDKMQPKDWKQVLEAVNIIGSFIPAETVEAIRAHAAEHRISPIGKTGE